MDLQTLNEDEFATLHPSVKKYLTAGIDTNKHGEKLVSEKNFFNMDLFNSDPYELDPDLSKRTEKFKTLSTGGELTGNLSVNNGTNLQVFLNAGDGCIEITRASGNAFIDFKNSTSEDFDLTREQKFQVFLNVCDNMLKEGRISKAQHQSWTNIF